MPFLGLLYYSFFIFILISFSSPFVEASPRVSPPLLPFPIHLLPLSYPFISDSAPFILFTSFYFPFGLFLNLFFDSAIIPFSHFLHPPCTPFFSSSYLFLRLCILFELLAQSSVASRVFFSLRSPKAQSDSVGFTGAVYPEAVTNGGGSLLPGRRGPLRRRPQRHATGNYIFLCFCVSTFIV